MKDSWNEDDEEQLKIRLKSLPLIPFTDALKEETLRKLQSVSTRTVPRQHRKWTEMWRRVGTVAAGWVVAAGLIYGTWQRSQNGSMTESSHTNKAAGAAQTYELARAPLHIDDVRIGTASGTAKNAVVYAQLTNTGTKPLRKSDVFGVLSFSDAPHAFSLADANWSTFVNAPDSQILPGQTVTWSFRPFGAPHTSAGALTEYPVLSFYRVAPAPFGRGDVVWNRADIQVTGIQVLPRTTFGGGQSIGVAVSVSNPSGQAIALRDILALIWFSERPTESFATAVDTRFISSVASKPGQQNVIAAHHQATLYFRLVAGANADFFSTTPHVTFIFRH